MLLQLPHNAERDIPPHWDGVAGNGCKRCPGDMKTIPNEELCCLRSKYNESDHPFQQGTFEGAGADKKCPPLPDHSVLLEIAWEERGCLSKFAWMGSAILSRRRRLAVAVFVVIVTCWTCDVMTCPQSISIFRQHSGNRGSAHFHNCNNFSMFLGDSPHTQWHTQHTPAFISIFCFFIDRKKK